MGTIDRQSIREPPPDLAETEDQDMINATPTKLRSGNWGARVQGRVHEGDVITITTRAGKSWQAEVAKVVWSGNGVSICATESAGPRRSGRRASQYANGYCYYPCPVSGRKCCPENGPCHDCE